MLAAIQLNHVSGFEADKIGNVWPDRLLAAKFEPVKLSPAKRIPELALDFRLVAAKLFCKIVFHGPSPGALCAPPSPTKGRGQF